MSLFNKFNKPRYLELLSQNNLSEQDKNELRFYRIILERQITFNNRDKYISLVEELLEEISNSLPISDSEDFDWDNFEPAAFKISELLDQELEDFDILENQIRKEGIAILDNFAIDPNARKFSELIIFIDRYDSDTEIEIEEDDYRGTIEWALKKLRDYANPTYNDSEVLQSVMVFFALGVVGVFSILDSTLFS